MSATNIVVLDYGSGNLRSAERALTEAGRRSGAGSHTDGLLDDAVTRRRQDDED